MINGKLKKPVSALTQADIDNKTQKSGTVSGAMLAGIGGDGGDGGYTVLKNWTRTTATDTNLFEGIDLGGNYNGVIVEFDNVFGDAGGGSTIDDYINLRFKMLGAVDLDIANRSSEVLEAGSVNGTGQNGADDRFMIFTCVADVKHGYGSARLHTNVDSSVAGYMFEGTCLSSWDNGLKNNHNKTFAGFRGDVVPQELWLHGVSDALVPFSADYRIIKVGSDL